MSFYVYLLLSSSKGRFFSYVGYSSNLQKRIKLHNLSKGAKYTKGKKWKLIYSKKISTKSLAMKEEYKLKKNYKLKKLIKQKYINKNK